MLSALGASWTRLQLWIILLPINILDSAAALEIESGQRCIWHACASLHILELQDPLEHLLVLVAAEVLIVLSRVPGVEGVVADAVEGLIWQRGFVVLQHLVEVFVMAKWHRHFVQATLGLVHAKFGATEEDMIWSMEAIEKVCEILESLPVTCMLLLATLLEAKDIRSKLNSIPYPTVTAK